ncbi:hypothetical protein PISL3812_09827 [Talaromyces islandicus]|uniref:Oxidoreductase-like domain-containing protein n=1 Tax=Talaromyces islandicus TaxID=28573 RepID=A0A0U1MCM4_TALIS|nr:hypothetical protein PISL3812_09827 [Talaromyces islandicus]
MQRCIRAQRGCAPLRQLCTHCRSQYLFSFKPTLRPHPKTAVLNRPRRCFSHNTLRRDEAETGSHSRGSTASQAHPLSGYYYDLLYNNPYPRRPAARTVERPKDEEQQQQEQQGPSKEEKMSIVFGTRLAGPGYQSTRYNPETMPPESTWKTINGVPIPPRPSEPDNCCMSGCVHCVWDDYRDDLESWASRIQQARTKISNAASNIPQSDMRQSPRKEVASASMSMDDDGGGSESNWELPSQDGEELFAGIPVGIKEFMRTEKKLREKKQQAA